MNSSAKGQGVGESIVIECGQQQWELTLNQHQVRFVESGESNKTRLIRQSYDQYRDELCRYLVRQFELGLATAEDVVQAAFARLAETNVILDLKNPRAFLYKMVINTCLDQKRKAKVRADFRTLTEADAERDLDRTDPAEQAEARQELTIISNAIRKMPDKRRKLLLMSRFDGLSYAEIARRMNLSETVVRKHINKALADCQAQLNRQGDVAGGK